MPSFFYSSKNDYKEKNYKKYVYILWFTGLYIIIPLFSAFLFQALQNGDIMFTIHWVRNNIAAFAVNSLIALSIFAAISSIVGNLYLAVSIHAFIFFIVGLANFFKMRYLGEPIFPWDFMRLKESAWILPYIISVKGIISIICCVAVVVAIPIIGSLLPRLRLHIVTRACIFVASMLFIFSLLFYKMTPAGNILTMLKIDNIYWNQNYNYQQNGFLLSFSMNVQNVFISSPDGYTQTYMLKLGDEIHIKEERKAKIPMPDVPPDIIIVMSEAFWDVTNLKGLTFSQEPLPNIRKLSEEGYVGTMVSPQIGGSTCNVEFEALTGFSMKFFPDGSIPYQQYIKEKIPSLPWYLKNLGYDTAAVHTYGKNFWDRDKVYGFLGFDKFIGLEDMPDAYTKGEFVSDDVLTGYMIKELENAKKPLFLFGVSMQNHLPYVGGRYTEDEMEVDIQGEEGMERIEDIKTYTQGIHDADKALGNLINYLEMRDKPCVLVFFGDHLPSFGGHFGVYSQSGYVNSPFSYNWTPDEILSMRSIPAALWTHGIEYNEEEVVGPLKDTSTWELPKYVLEAAKLPKNYFYKQLDTVITDIKAMTRDIFMDQKGDLYTEPPDNYDKILQRYHILNYDAIFGKKYVYNYLWDK